MSVWRRYSLSIVLWTLFAVSLAAQFGVGWLDHISQQTAHNLPPDVASYLWFQLNEMFANWQSEFLQLASFVLLTAYLIHERSPQSKDGDDEMRESLVRLERKLDAHTNDTAQMRWRDTNDPLSGE